MDRPPSRIVRIKGNHHTAARRHKNRVAYCTGEPFAVNLNDLELVPVQVHGMRHLRLVYKDELNALSFSPKFAV
jgi:hypothetical protein